MKAPDFKVVPFGSKAESTFYKTSEGYPTLLMFIQTACKSCNREVNFVKEMLDDFPEFRSIIVFIDHRDLHIADYMKENDLSSLCCVAWDESDEIAGTYGVTFSPISFLVSKDREVISVYKGFHRKSAQIIRSDLEKLLGKPK